MITINTLYDLWKRFTVYPMCIQYFLKDYDIMGYIDDMDDMRKFFDEYMDYEVVDFSILAYMSDSIALGVVLKKGETEDD